VDHSLSDRMGGVVFRHHTSPLRLPLLLPQYVAEGVGMEREAARIVVGHLRAALPPPLQMAEETVPTSRWPDTSRPDSLTTEPSDRTGASAPKGISSRIFARGVRSFIGSYPFRARPSPAAPRVTGGRPVSSRPMKVSGEPRPGRLRSGLEARELHTRDLNQR
jgi:hypothetical protein